jgi:hypothetical protein
VEVAEGWRRLHNEELHTYGSPYIIRVIKSRRMICAGQTARRGDSRNANKILIGKPLRKIPLGRPRSSWRDNTETDLQETEYEIPPSSG